MSTVNRTDAALSFIRSSCSCRLFQACPVCLGEADGDGDSDRAKYEPAPETDET